MTFGSQDKCWPRAGSSHSSLKSVRSDRGQTQPQTHISSMPSSTSTTKKSQETPLHGKAQSSVLIATMGFSSGHKAALPGQGHQVLSNYSSAPLERCPQSDTVMSQAPEPRSPASTFYTYSGCQGFHKPHGQQCLAASNGSSHITTSL